MSNHVEAQSVDFGHGNYSTLIDKKKPKKDMNLLKPHSSAPPNLSKNESHNNSKLRLEKRMFGKVNSSAEEPQKDESESEEERVPLPK